MNSAHVIAIMAAILQTCDPKVPPEAVMERAITLFQMSVEIAENIHEQN